MKISTKARYATMALLQVAIEEESGPVTLAQISRRQRISLSYLEQIFTRLRRDGLVEGTRGPGGGYRLGKAAEAITIADVLAALGDTDSGRTGNGIVEELWTELAGRIQAFLSRITLAQMIGPHRKKAAG